MPAPDMVGYLIAGYAGGDSAESLLVIHNARREAVEVTIPEDRWTAFVDERTAGTKPLWHIKGSSVTAAPQSTLVLVRR